MRIENAQPIVGRDSFLASNRNHEPSSQTPILDWKLNVPLSPLLAKAMRSKKSAKRKTLGTVAIPLP